jgi:hypothetical protein
VLRASAPVFEYRSLYHGIRVLAVVAGLGVALALIGWLGWGRDAFLGLLFGSAWAVVLVGVLGRSSTLVTTNGITKVPRLRRRSTFAWPEIEAFSERMRKTRSGSAVVGVAATLANGHSVALEDGFEDEGTVVFALDAELARHRGGAAASTTPGAQLPQRMQLSPRAAALHAAAFLTIALWLGGAGVALGATQTLLASDGVHTQATITYVGQKTHRYKGGYSCPFSYQFVDPRSGVTYTTQVDDCDTYDRIELGETIAILYSASQPGVNQLNVPDPAAAFFTAATFWWLFAVPGIGRVVAFARARRLQAASTKASATPDLVTRLAP